MDRRQRGRELALLQAAELASVAGPHGIGGDGGGPVGDPGARGNPGLGNGPASGMKLKYPEESRRFGEEGTVILAIEIMPDGQHGEIEVVQSSGYWRLDEAALDAARRANYAAPWWTGDLLPTKHASSNPLFSSLKMRAEPECGKPTALVRFYLSTRGVT